MNAEEPLVLFGVLTDIQYADCDSKPAWWNSQLTRYYRTALNQIDKAFTYWRRIGPVSFALQLGDIIDGVNRQVSDPDTALQEVLARFESYKDIPTFHTVGNHELYNFYRRDLATYFHEYLNRMNLPKWWFGFPNEEENELSRTGDLRSEGAEIVKRNNIEEYTVYRNMQTNLTRQMLIRNLNEALITSKRSKSELRQSASEPQLAGVLNTLKRTSSLTPEMFISLFMHCKVQEIAYENRTDANDLHLGLTHNLYSKKSNPKNIETELHCTTNSGETTDEHELKEDSSNTIQPETVEFTVGDKSSQNDSTSLYYTFRPVPGVKLISLDCFEVAVIGYDKTDSKYEEAADILFEHHGHQDFEGWDCADLLEGPQKRFQQMNGAVSEQQLHWLNKELQESDQVHEKVIVFGHVCLHPDSADWDCLLWNYERVLDIFHAHSCVTLYLCGHTHQNGYALDRKGIHYVVLAGIIETAPEETAFSTIAIYQNRIEIMGHGRETSRTLWLESAETNKKLNGADGSIDVQAESLHLAPSVKVLV